MNPLRWLYALVALMAIGAGVYGVWSYRSMTEQAAQLAPLRADLDDLKQSYTRLSAQVVKRDEHATAIRQNRSAITKRIEDATKADPDARAWLDTPIPDGVRQAFKHPTDHQP